MKTGFIYPPCEPTTPVNLLDNSDFRNPIAQSGRNSCHGSNKYVCDRWITWNLDVTFNTGYATVNSPIDQRVDPALIDPSKIYTVAIGLADNKIITHNGTIDTGMGLFSTIWFGKRDGVYFVRIGASQDVVWAALYEGKYTAATLPTFMPPDPTLERIKCQRYYTLYETSGDGIMSTGIVNNRSDSLYLPLQLLVSMRAGVQPTALYNDINLFKVFAGDTLPLTDIVTHAYDTNPEGCKYITLRAGISGLGLAPGGAAQLNLKAGAKLAFSCEM